ncbi:unnamed protein product, partial [Closterium sp. Yama58-4]
HRSHIGATESWLHLIPLRSPFWFAYSPVLSRWFALPWRGPRFVRCVEVVGRYLLAFGTDDDSGGSYPFCHLSTRCLERGPPVPRQLKLSDAIGAHGKVVLFSSVIGRCVYMGVSSRPGEVVAMRLSEDLEGADWGGSGGDGGGGEKGGWRVKRNNDMNGYVEGNEQRREGSNHQVDMDGIAFPLLPCLLSPSLLCSQQRLAHLFSFRVARLDFPLARKRLASHSFSVHPPPRRGGVCAPSSPRAPVQHGASRRLVVGAKYLGKFGSAPPAPSAAPGAANSGVAAAARSPAASNTIPALARQLLPLTAAVVIPVAATAAAFAAAGFGERDADRWFRSLNPPSFAPPDWLLAATWTVLQLPAGAASWMVLRQGGWARQRGAMEIYLVQLAVGLLWPIVMFRLKKIDAAAAVAGALTVSSLSTFLVFYRASPVASLLYLPMLVWLGLISAITYSIWTNHSVLLDKLEWDDVLATVKKIWRDIRGLSSSGGSGRSGGASSGSSGGSGWGAGGWDGGEEGRHGSAAPEERGDFWASIGRCKGAGLLTALCVIAVASALLVLGCHARPLSSSSDVIESGPLDQLCPACMSAVLQAHMVLSAPDTASDLIDIVETYACSQLDAEKEAKCNALVEQYVPLVIAEMDNEITVDKVCVRFHICPPSPDETNPAVDLTPATPKDILAYTIQEALLGEAVSDPEDVAGAANVIAEVAAVEDENALHNREDCVACLMMVRVIRKRLSDPKMQARIMDFVIGRCNKLSNESLTAECISAAQDILPVIFEELPKVLDPKKVCKKAGLCSSLPPVEGMVGAGHSDDDAKLPLLLQLPSDKN